MTNVRGNAPVESSLVVRRSKFVRSKFVARNSSFVAHPSSFVTRCSSFVARLSSLERVLD